ncbi:MAG: type I polyketide synthase [Betaproteobacteria bacterium]|nr:type I polyketide synthase [Betaproteobacteria bacterium]
MGGIFPGSPTLEDFWHIVEQGRDTCRPVPAGRWPLNSEAVQNATAGAPDAVFTDRGCFVEGFAPELSVPGLSRETAASLDPMVHLLVHAGRAAFAGARTENLDRNGVGVVIGNIALPSAGASALCDEVLGPLFEHKVFGRAERRPSLQATPLNRYVTGLPAGILARALGLGGGCYALDAACASSLYAVTLACDELLAHRADAMLAGGLSRPDSLYTQMGFSQLRALSPSGRCSPFDRKGDGLIVGEGAGIVVLKRLADALRDGDRVLALIRGAGLSNDTEGNLLSPSSEGQLRALRIAYAQAGWTPDMVDLIECHATGTPVGDAVEFASLCRLWEGSRWHDGPCVLSAVKSNIGHLLTAAGSAGLIKTLLAMQHGVLPPVANFEQPSEKVQLAGSPFAILKHSRPWERRAASVPRRAAVNGFGFGGINAHLLIEEWLGETAAARNTAGPVPSREAVAVSVAIVGMAARLGRWSDLRAFEERVLGGGGDGPEERSEWRGLSSEQIRGVWGGGARLFPGYYLDDLSVPIDRFHIPPRELAEMLPQQILMLDVARSALEDAQISDLKSSRAGVFIGLGLDLRTTDFHFRWTARHRAAEWARKTGLDPGSVAIEQWKERLCDAAGLPLTADRTLGALGGIVASRVAREFHVSGPSHCICGEETSGLHALEAGVRALQRGDLDTVLAGAVDLSGDLRALLATNALRPYSSDGSAKPFDIGANGAIPGEGAACVVLKRLADAQRDGDRIYAVIRGVGAANGNAGEAMAPEPAAYQRALTRAYAEAGVASGVELLETHGSGAPDEDAAEAQALADFFGNGARSTACNIASAKADVGHAGAASGLVSLVKASLCLYRETIPALRGCDVPRHELAGANGLRAPRASRHWVRNRADGPRRAGVSAMGTDGGCVHVVLEGPEPVRAAIEFRPRPRVAACPDELFTLAAASRPALVDELIELERIARASGEASAERVARQWWRSRGRQTGPYRIALLARDTQQLTRLTELARAADRGNLRTDVESRERIFASAGSATGATGRIAFVFPGSGNQFGDMGRELALQWPDVLRTQDRENARLANQMQADRFWNGSLAPDLLADHRALICGQVCFGTMVADLAASFGIRPDAAIGYSLGESTALLALRALRQRDEMLDRLSTSPLFAHDLAGNPETLRKAWNLPDDQRVEWVTGMIDRSAQAARAAIGNGRRAYVLISNTPSECVIGGDRTAVEQVVATLACLWFPLQGVSTVHCELARPVRDAYRELHRFDTKPPAGVEFYSCALGRAYVPEREATANAIEAQAMDTVDFPRIICAAYDSGVRTFIEVGPGNSCSRMIGNILEGRAHFAKSLAIASPNPVTHFLRTLGQLHAEGVPLDLAMHYGGDADVEPRPRASSGASEKCVTVSITGAPFAAPAPPAQSAPEELAEHDFGHAVLVAMSASEQATIEAHEAYLRFSQDLSATLAQAVAAQVGLLEQAARTGVAVAEQAVAPERFAPPAAPIARAPALTAEIPRSLERAACLEFGRGRVGRVLGPKFAEADSFPTRVRLPDEPLMLVDRILEIHGEPLSMTHGRVVTEHDIHPGAWYLDCGRIPTCIAVEAGQADLFLSGYLGIDFQTRGRSMYRLLDAKVRFHRGLPGAHEVIRYDIRIEDFFRQNDTWLFRFGFEATLGGEPLLSMTEGCAGFFSREELAAGKGVVRTALDLEPKAGKRAAEWEDFTRTGIERYSAEQLDALRAGDLAGCFGEAFAGLAGMRPVTLPGGQMKLVHRIAHLDPAGGRFGLGIVIGEADIRPDDWFLTCHFVDDRVMPGTLMFECCLHTLRVFMLRLGWIAEEGQVVLEPLPGVASRLKCRGQVLDTTKLVTYEISVKEIGCRPAPFVIADALMYADGKPIVEISDMSLRCAGATMETFRALWSAAGTPADKPAIFDRDRILAFAVGKPSDAFGEPYRIFDRDRVIARLPGPPYQFLDRITEIRAEPWKIVPGGECAAQYDVPPDAWYFADNRQGDMPFAVLLEIALQPCGWLAAYMGSALTSEVDVSFRNLGGSATQFAAVLPGVGTLSVRVKLTRASSSAGMIIQFFDYEVRAGRMLIYTGDTYFGFFPKLALLKQEGLKDAARHQPTAGELARSRSLDFPQAAPFPAGRLRLLDRIECWIPDGGPKGLGFIRATRRVDAGEWFFKAHFFQDPVVPGSLGLESLLQLLKFIAAERWGAEAGSRREAVATGERHEWVYRGQVIPADREVTLEAVVTAVDANRRLLRADGYLSVDGRVIYAMKDFTVRQHEG